MEATKEAEKIVIGSEAAAKVVCSSCQKEGTADAFFTMQDSKGKTVHLCPECKVKANEAFEAETKNPNFPLAVIVGALGAAIGGAIWYFITITTEREIGYISLGLGYLIGYGVYLGSGKKRGSQLQLLSGAIAVIAIIITERFVFTYFVNDYVQTHPTEFPNILPGEKVYIPLTSPDFWSVFLSPIGLLIYAIGVYFAYRFCKPKRI